MPYDGPFVPYHVIPVPLNWKDSEGPERPVAERWSVRSYAEPDADDVATWRKVSTTAASVSWTVSPSTVKAST